MKHLRVTGLVAAAVIEKACELLLRLLLALDVSGALQALGARDRRHHGGQIGELLRLDADELVARLRRLLPPCQ